MGDKIINKRSIFAYTRSKYILPGTEGKILGKRETSDGQIEYLVKFKGIAWPVCVQEKDIEQSKLPSIIPCCIIGFILMSVLPAYCAEQIYDKDGRYKGVIENNRIYDEKSNLKYTIDDKGRIYDREGNYKYKIDREKK